MTEEERLRLKGYWLILYAGDGRISLLTLDERDDLHQLLQKWMDESYE